MIYDCPWGNLSEQKRRSNRSKNFAHCLWLVICFHVLMIVTDVSVIFRILVTSSKRQWLCFSELYLVDNEIAVCVFCDVLLRAWKVSSEGLMCFLMLCPHDSFEITNNALRSSTVLFLSRLGQSTKVFFLEVISVNPFNLEDYFIQFLLC